MIFYELNKQQKVVGIVSSAIVEATLEEAINTAGKLKFTTSSKLRNDCYYILFKRPSAETYMCFKILTETQNNNQVKYTAVESAYDELASYSYIKDIRPQNHSAKEMLTQILSVTRYQVGYVADTPGKTTNFYYKSVLESLQELTNLFGLEITFDVVFDANDNQIKRRLVNLYKQQGNRTGKRFEYGDKLLSVTKEQSSEELVTALVGRGSSVQVSEGSDGSPDGYSRKITFADIEWKKASGNPLDKPLGQEFLEDPSATALYGFSDGKPRIGIIEFSNIKDKNELIQATYEKLQELKRPKVSFKAAVTDVGDLALGDTVAIIRHDLQIEYLTRVYKVTHNLLNEQDNTVEFGDSFQSASITNKLSNIQQDVQSARERSESAVQAANGKNTNFYSSSKPSSAIEGDLWYKDLGNGETELYAWHNGNWELVVSTADTTAVKRQVEQAQADLAQVRADANRISETQTESAKRLDEQMKALQAKTVDNATNVQNVIRDVAQAHTDYLNQQADISKQKADLEKTQQDLLANSESIESFNGKVSKFQVDLDGINSQVVSNTGAINQFKITENEISQSMKDAQSNIETLKLTAKSFEQKFADTDGNIATIKRDATELSEQLATKVGNTEYQNFKTQTAKELSEKLVKTDLNGYATTAEVKLTADGLKEQYNSVKSKVDNLKIGGVNLIDNGGNPSNTDGWTVSGTSRNKFLKVGTHAFWKNSQEKLFILYNVDQTYEATMSSKRIKVERNTDYTLSYWAFNDGHVVNTDTFFLARKDGETDDFTRVFTLIAARKYSVSKAEYVTVTFNTGDNDEGYIRFDNNKTYDTQCALYLANIQLEKGNVATDYGPSANDVANAISGVSKDLTSYKAVVERDYAKNSSVYTKNEVVNLTNNSKDSAVNAIKNDTNWKGLVNINTNSAFLQTADGFESEVVKKATPLVEGGGVNLVPSSGKPADTARAGWYGVAVYPHAFWKNGKENVFVINNGDTKYEKSASSDWITVERGGTYTVSFYACMSGNCSNYDLFFLGRKKGETAGFTQIRQVVATQRVSGAMFEYRKFTFNVGQSDEGYLRFDNNGSTDGNNSVFLFTYVKMEKGTVATPWSPTPEDLATVVSVNKVIDTADSHTQIIKDYLTGNNSRFTQLKDAVNLKVAKGDVIGQINLEAGKTLLQNKKIYLDADTVAFSNKAFIPSAAITELSADKITTGTLNAAAVKVINLDASKITTGKLNGMAVKIDGKTSEIDMTTDRGVIFRQKSGTWATTLTSYQIQFENNSSGQSEILGSLTAQYNTESKNINGIGIVIPTQQKLGAPYGGDEFSIGYATDRNGHSTSDFIYNASGQVRSKGFHWYESSHLYGKAQVLYIDGAHDPLWIRGVKFDKSSQNGYYQPTISAGWGGNTYGNSGISFLWDSILLYGSVQLGNIRVADATNAIGVGWTSWSDWNNEKYPSFTNENGSNHGGIAFPPNGNTVVWSGMTGQRQNTWK